jgi:hypothetical protein
MSDERQTSEQQAREKRQAARRRFLKVAATGVAAAPVIESITGSKLMVVSAQVQTEIGQGFDGPFNGSLDVLA